MFFIWNFGLEGWKGGGEMEVKRELADCFLFCFGEYSKDYILKSVNNV